MVRILRSGKRVAVTIASIATCVLTSLPYVYADNSEVNKSIKVYTLDMNDATPMATLKKEVIEQYLASNPTITMEDVNLDASIVKTTAFDRTRSGIQTITVSASIVFNDGVMNKRPVGYDYSEQAVLKVIGQNCPQIVLRNPEVYTQEGSSFDTVNNIGVITGTGKSLPILEVDHAVDTNNPGDYTVTIKATDATGTTSETAYTVHVQAPEQVQEEKKSEEVADATVEEKEDTTPDIIIDGTDTSTAAIAQAALAQVGVHQDCTMLVTNALKAVGIYFHGWPYEYLSLGTITDNPVPGDIIVYEGHVAIYIGNGMAVHGGFNGNNTAVFSVNVSTPFIAYVHINL